MKFPKIKKKTAHFISGEKTKIGLFSSVVMLVCIIGAVNAFQYGWANLNYYSARNFIEQWQSNGAVGSSEEFLVANNAIQSASNIHSSHPLYKDTKGQVIEWGVFAGFSPKSSLDQADASYRESLALRPTWPVTWANLAITKWRKAEIDDTLLHYLKMADKFGPVKPEVNRLFAEIGLRLYQQNHPSFTEISSLVKHRVLLGLKNQQSRAEVITAIDRTEQQETVCAWIEPLNESGVKKHLNCDK